MKILLLTQVFPPRLGGSGRWLWELYRRLTTVSVHVVAGATNGAEEFDRTAPLRIVRMPLDFANWGLIRGGVQYLRRILHLRRLVKEVRPDAVHAGKCLPEGLLARMLNAATGVPFLVYVHGEELTLARTSRELRMLTGHVLRSAHRLVANSEHTRRILVQGWRIKPDKIVVMHPGVDTDQFTVTSPNAELRRRFGWEGRTVVLTVGALQKRKGQDMMIRALSAIREHHPGLLYVVAGEGWERPLLEKLVAELGVSELVQFRGAPGDTELIELYQQCDLFVLPNRQVSWDFEGFGIVSIEAQACGKAVVVGASGGSPETVRPGITGLIVPCETPGVLAQAVSTLLGDHNRLKQMGTEGRRWVTERFDWSVLSAAAAQAFRNNQGTHLTARSR